MCDVGVRLSGRQVGVWCEGYHRGELLCIRWDPDPPLERETSPEMGC